MIGKGMAITHTQASMQYGMNQDKMAEVVYKAHLAGETPSEVTQEFKILQDTNSPCQKNYLEFCAQSNRGRWKEVECKET